MYAPIAAPVCAGPGSWRGARLAGLSIQLSAVVQRGNPAPLIAPCSRPDNPAWRAPAEFRALPTCDWPI